MKAIVYERYGGEEVLEHREVPEPTPGAGEVLIRVAAAGLDRGTWHLMAGKPHLIRLGFGLRAPKEPVLGMDLAGEVLALGEGVTELQVGDEVFGIGRGSFAERACAPVTKLAPKPSELSFEEAAAMPVSASTALQALCGAGSLQAGQSVLITGASGGVGHFAVQIAKAKGAVVTGVCSGGKADWVRSLGADEVVDYTTEDFTNRGLRYDLILDLAGNRGLSALRRALSPRGTLLIAGGEEGGALLGGLDRQLRALLWSPFLKQRLRAFLAGEGREHLLSLRPLIAAGQLRPHIDRVFALHEAADAMRHLTQGKARGKLVLRMP